MKKVIFKKILVTHDGSECASAVLPYVKSLASTLNAKIVLLRVVGPFIPEFSSPDIGPIISSISYGVSANEIAEEVKKSAIVELEEVKKELMENGLINIKTVVLEGYAPEIILYIVKKEKIDLIMMSTHGRTGLKKALLGSVTEQTIHASTCPVFTVHPLKKTKK